MMLIRVLGLTLLISACTVEVKKVANPVVLPMHFSSSGTAQSADRWWQNFNDPYLNQLVETALQGNQDFQATFNRLQQAQAIARKAGSELVPALNGSTQTSRTINDVPGFDKVTTDAFSIGLSASYELDLWGRIRATTRAAELDSTNAALDIQTAAIALSAQIARAWVQLIEQQLQLQLLAQQIITNQQYVDLVMARFKGGQATAADVFQQRQVLEAVRGDSYTVLATIKVLKNQLAVLAGVAPGSLSFPSDPHYPGLPGLPVTGLTAELVQRRPDLRQAHYRIQAADLRVAAAIADRFPKLSFATSITTNAPNLQDFFNNWLATLAGNLVIPIIDGGRRVAEVARNQALTDEAINLYGQKLLSALEEVENALAQEQLQQQRLNSLDKQLRYLNDANTQIRLRYGYGGIDFLRVLSSLTSLQSTERSHLRAQRELLEYRINLYRALAGGWSVQTPSPDRAISHD